MNEERLKELTEFNCCVDAVEDADIQWLASALLAAQKRVAELEEENRKLKDDVEGLNSALLDAMGGVTDWQGRKK